MTDKQTVKARGMAVFMATLAALCVSSEAGFNLGVATWCALCVPIMLGPNMEGES